MKCPSLEALVEISLIPRNSILRQLPYLRPGSLNLISSFHHWWNSSYCSRCSVFLPTWVSIQKSKVSYNPLYIHESIELTGFLHVSWSKHRMNVVRSFNPWCGKMTIPTFHQSHRTWLTPWQEKNELSSTSHFTGSGYPVSKKHIWIQGGSNHLHEKTAKIEKYLAAIQGCWDATTKKPPMTLGATKDVEQTLSPFQVVLTGSLGWNRPENVVPFVRKITGVVPIMLLSSMGKHKKCFKRYGKKIE